MLQNVKHSKIEKIQQCRNGNNTDRSSLHTDSFWRLYFPSTRKCCYYKFASRVNQLCNCAFVQRGRREELKFPQQCPRIPFRTKPSCSSGHCRCEHSGEVQVAPEGIIACEIINIKLLQTVPVLTVDNCILCYYFPPGIDVSGMFVQTPFYL